MQRSSSKGGGPSTQGAREDKGQVVVLDAWKSKKKQLQRRVERQRRRGPRSALRMIASIALVLEVVAALVSCLPSPYELHSIVAAWILGIVTCITGLWLNVRMDLAATRILLWGSLGMLLALAAGLVRMSVS